MEEGTWILLVKVVVRGQVAHLLLLHTIDLNKVVRVGLVSKGKERIPSEHLYTPGPR